MKIEPHLGALKHLSAGMPTPKGMVEVEYSAEKSGLKAILTLPGGLSGQLVWQGTTFQLHEGKQALDIPLN